MATLTLRRPDDAGGIARRMAFLVDGRVVARLRRGDSQRVEVTAGRHRLRVRTDWQRSREVEVDLGPDEEVTVEGAVPAGAATLTNTFLRPGAALELSVINGNG
ncbi:hypothetical protein [Asanoa siamensis]|uniref:Uncharacterized protein n=1 Tax=Asanoa siamensis TaxID=926357 RepID=A0ABQ4CVY1_9ACTN|nr:hypothetical protein [Asanoa siamensis]GIF75451.1 hypothetical protein Asi02nite_49690 [Asanoa siamensis]